MRQSEEMLFYKRALLALKFKVSSSVNPVAMASRSSSPLPDLFIPRPRVMEPSPSTPTRRLAVVTIDDEEESPNAHAQQSPS